MRSGVEQGGAGPSDPKRGGRIVILSDTHMHHGRQGAGDAAALRPLWQGANRLVFNGDTVETRSPHTREVSMRRLDELRALTREDGVELSLIAGNHDPFVSEDDWLELLGGAVAATHGDVLHDEASPWAGAASDEQKRAAGRAWRREKQHAYETAQSTALSRWVRRARRLYLVLHYWTVMPGRAMRLARHDFPRCEVFLFGHIHLPGVWVDRDALGPGRDRVVINTGSFHRPRRPRVVVIEDGELTLWKIRGNRRRGFRLSARPDHTLRLHGSGGSEPPI